MIQLTLIKQHLLQTKKYVFIALINHQDLGRWGWQDICWCKKRISLTLHMQFTLSSSELLRVLALRSTRMHFLAYIKCKFCWRIRISLTLPNISCMIPPHRVCFLSRRGETGLFMQRGLNNLLSALCLYVSR